VSTSISSATPATTVTLTFLGAAGAVTGSKFLIESAGRRVLLDCGLFQGERSLRRRNWDALPLDPGAIDAVVLTHAHLDHCGYLPVLVRGGFSGPVLCSEDTARLVPIVLRDAAYLQEEDARFAARTGTSRHDPPLPLFDSGDAEKAISCLAPVPRHVPQDVADGFTATLFRAGHILGSSFVRIDVRGASLVFSGDLGRPDHPLLLPPEPLGEVDHVIVESTYGDRAHEAGMDEALADVLTRTLERGGVALIPAFAVDRTPMVLHEIVGLVRAGKVPDVPVFVDSPMALDAFAVYRTSLAGPDFRPELAARDPFDPGHLRLIDSVKDSEKLNRPNRPCIIVSASGMATGGRVLHHLEHQLPNPRNSVVLTGFQVAGTRGRALADGARELKIHGRYIPVRAEVANIRGFSAHADADQLLAWLASGSIRHTVFVVHGEPEASDSLAERIRGELGSAAVVPRYGEKVRVD
jgi:metallo-beta-lactamase family protein